MCVKNMSIFRVYVIAMLCMVYDSKTCCVMRFVQKAQRSIIVGIYIVRILYESKGAYCNINIMLLLTFSCSQQDPTQPQQPVPFANNHIV